MIRHTVRRSSVVLDSDLGNMGSGLEARLESELTPRSRRRAVRRRRARPRRGAWSFHASSLLLVDLPRQSTQTYPLSLNWEHLWLVRVHESIEHGVKHQIQHCTRTIAVSPSRSFRIAISAPSRGCTVRRSTVFLSFSDCAA